MKCKDCGYWGGCDSMGDYRKCYHVDIYSKLPPEIKCKNDTCEWKKDKKKVEREKNESS